MVEQLSRALKIGGVAVWLDRQNLRGGDNWERVITHVIEKQVDYFVPVQAVGMTRLKGCSITRSRWRCCDRTGCETAFKFVIPVHTESRYPPGTPA